MAILDNSGTDIFQSSSIQVNFHLSIETIKTMKNPDNFLSNMNFTCLVIDVSFLSIGIFDLYNFYGADFDGAGDDKIMGDKAYQELLFALIGGGLLFSISLFMHFGPKKK